MRRIGWVELLSPAPAARQRLDSLRLALAASVLIAGVVIVAATAVLVVALSVLVARMAAAEQIGTDDVGRLATATGAAAAAGWGLVRRLRR